MNKKDIFDRICLVEPIPEGVFQLHLKSTVQDIKVRYGEKYTENSDSEISLRCEYENALYMGILYRVTGRVQYDEEYRRLANGAYYRVWRELEKKRRKDKTNDV